MDKRLRFTDSLLDLACVFSITAVLMAGTANAQAGKCSMPGQMYISGSGSGTDMNMPARQGGNGIPQTPSGNVMNVLIPITVGVVAVDAAAAVIPAMSIVVMAGDIMAPVGMTTIYDGIIGGVALATLMDRMGGDVLLDNNGQAVAPAVIANAGDVSSNGHQWYCSFGNVVGGGVAYGASPSTVCAAALPASGFFKYTETGTDSNTGALCEMATSYSNPPMCYAAYLYSTDRCVTGYVAPGSSCVVDPAALKVPVTSAQTQNAIKAYPNPWPSIYSNMNCGSTLALANGSTSGPYYRLYNDSRAGFGASFSTGGSSWSNNGCVANSTSYPSAVVTTAPTADTQMKTSTDGNRITTNMMTTRTTTVTGTNGWTNPAVGQTTTTTTTMTTIINTDGSATTTTGTTTDRAPPQTDTSTNQQQKDQTRLTTVTFVSLDIELYDKKTKTLGDVLNIFRNTIRASATGVGVQGFFTVGAPGSCPQWVVSQTDWTPSIMLGPIFCSSSASLVYQIAGYAVLAAAVFATFAIAFL